MQHCWKWFGQISIFILSSSGDELLSAVNPFPRKDSHQHTLHLQLTRRNTHTYRLQLPDLLVGTQYTWLQLPMMLFFYCTLHRKFMGSEPNCCLAASPFTICYRYNINICTLCIRARIFIGCFCQTKDFFGLKKCPFYAGENMPGRWLALVRRCQGLGRSPRSHVVATWRFR